MLVLHSWLVDLLLFRNELQIWNYFVNVNFLIEANNQNTWKSSMDGKLRVSYEENDFNNCFLLQKNKIERIPTSCTVNGSKNTLWLTESSMNRDAEMTRRHRQRPITKITFITIHFIPNREQSNFIYDFFVTLFILLKFEMLMSSILSWVKHWATALNKYVFLSL